MSTFFTISANVENDLLIASVGITLGPAKDFRVRKVRVNWQIKAILPVVFVLLAGLLLFTIATAR